MTVNIVHKPSPKFNLTAEDICNGEAYKDEYGTIYIGNAFAKVLAFSVCGMHCIEEGDNIKLRQIDLTITED